jgi:hypothetical protein
MKRRPQEKERTCLSYCTFMETDHMGLKHVYMLDQSFRFGLFSGAKMKSHIYLEPFLQKQMHISTFCKNFWNFTQK